MIRSLALVLLSCIALAGCGGSTEPASAPVEDGGETPESPSGTPPPETPTDTPPDAGDEMLTLSGVVTDAPIVDATVVVTVAGSSFEAEQPTGPDGAYTVDIDSDDAGALVRFEAVDPTGSVKLTSLAADFASLEAQAADGVVTNANVTNITTALDALVQADGDIDSAADLEAAVAGVDPARLLELSAAIKLVVEGIAGVTLPADVGDTQGLAEAIVAGTSSFIADVGTSAPGALDTAIERLLSDGHATPAFDADAAAGVYVARDGPETIALLPDGSGMTQPAAGASFDFGAWWVSGDGQLVLAYDGEGVTRDELTQLARMGDAVTLVRRRAELTEHGAPEPIAFEHVSFDGGFASESAAGSYERADSPGTYDVLLAGGAGYTIDAASGEQLTAFTWSVTADGSLALAPDDSMETRWTRLERGDDGALRVLSVTRAIGGALVDFRVESLGYSTQIVEAPVAGGGTEGMLAGHSFGVWADEPRLLSFGEDGTLALVEGDPAVETTGTWSLDGDGAIVLTTADATERYTVLTTVGDESLSVERDGGGPMEWTRAGPGDFETLIGTHLLYDTQGAPTGESYEFTFNSGGQRVVGNGAPVGYTWQIDADGRIVLDYGSNDETLYVLRGADASGAPVIRVRWGDGALERIDALRMLIGG